MAKKFYYAVKNGKNPGVYFNWDDCKKQVTGYKGAIYKKFESMEEAKKFVNNEKENVNIQDISTIKANQSIAYVDGSYNIKTKDCGFGVVLFTVNGKECYSRVVENRNYSDFRNVTGEIFGALFAINKSIEYGLDEVYIHYDYTGISNWALGNWKTNNDLTKSYKKEFDILKNKIKIYFIKVKAHTGDEYNEQADKLAKKAVGV